MSKFKLFHIPVCPFSQRIEILLALKGCQDLVEFEVIDITQPRPDWLIAKTGRPVPLPVLELPDGRVLRESMAILNFLDEVLPGDRIKASDPYLHATEQIVVARAESFTFDGYSMVMNQNISARPQFEEKMLAHYRELDRLLNEWAISDRFFGNQFGWVETVYTPIFMRFWFLEYYENFSLPKTSEFERVRRWIDLAIEHPAAQQVEFEEIIKLYYDYALGYGNGACPDNRAVSSFTFVPDWRQRPMPPKDKYGYRATDQELGL